MRYDFEHIAGCLLGGAVGDAIGLPMEGLKRNRLKRVFPEPYRHKFVFGRGMVSDDTEHMVMAAQAIIESAGNPELFGKSLARRLKRWLLLIPGGVGKATLTACVKLLLGVSHQRSGVFSAGNGPAMRSSLIGVCYGHDPEKMRELVKVSTRITHTDPKAEYGALAVALAAHLSSISESSPKVYLDKLTGILGPEGRELLELVERAVKSVEAGASAESFIEQSGWGNGVSGYIYATVPVVLHAWFKYPNDYGKAVSEVIRCGGDTDTTAAITGAIVGARVGKEGIPHDWPDGLKEWPGGIEWMEKLGKQLADVIQTAESRRPPGLPATAVFLRNTFFILVVLCHGFRRLLPK